MSHGTTLSKAPIESILTNPMTAAGDIIYGGTSGAPTRLAKGTDAQVLTLASGVPVWADASGGSLLVAETVVSGSAVTSVTFSDLDGNADGGYVLECMFTTTSASFDNAKLFINNDTATTYYQMFDVVYSSSGASVADASEVRVGNINQANDYSHSITDILCRSGDISLETHIIYDFSDGRRWKTTSGKYTQNINIASLVITCTGGAYIGAGSTFRLYRRK